MRALIFSNIYVSLGAALLTTQTCYLLGGGPTEGGGWVALVAVVFFATLVVYNLDRLLPSREDAVETSERHRWVRANRRILWGLSAVGAAAAGVALVWVPLRIVVPLAILGGVTVAYSVPVIMNRSHRKSAAEGPLTRARRLKDVPGLKIFLIALVWAAVTVVLPAMLIGVPLLSRKVLLIFWARACFIFAITLPFDVRDMARDRSAGVWTFPMALGTRRTRLLALGCMLLFGALVLLNFGFARGSAALPLEASALATAGALAFSASPRAELYYVGVLDGMMILQPALVIFSQWMS